MSKEQLIKGIIKHFAITSLLITISIIISILSFNSFMIPENETQAAWFQRSGSIVTLLNIIAEFVLRRVFYSTQMPATCKIKWIQKTYAGLNALAFILICAGTVIWGYGDHLY